MAHPILQAQKVSLIQLYMVRSGLKLEEATGMRMTGKAPKASTICKAWFGLKRNASFQEMKAALDAAIQQAEAQ